MVKKGLSYTYKYLAFYHIKHLADDNLSFFTRQRIFSHVRQEAFGLSWRLFTFIIDPCQVLKNICIYEKGTPLPDRNIYLLAPLQLEITRGIFKSGMHVTKNQACISCCRFIRYFSIQPYCFFFVTEHRGLSTHLILRVYVALVGK